MLKIIKIITYSIFLFPAIYLVRFNFFNQGTINLLDIFMVFFVISSLVIIKKYSWNKKFKIFLKNKSFLFLSVAIIFCGIIISSLKNFNYENYLNSLGIIKSFFVLPIFFAIFLSFLIKKKLIDKYLCFWFYFGYASLLGLLGVFYFLEGKITYDQRLELFFNSPNYLAMSLAPGIIIGIFLLIYNKPSFRNRIFVIIFLIIQFFSLFLTKSQGALLGLLAAISLLIVFQKKILIKRWTYCFFTIFLIIILFFFLNFSYFLNLIKHQPSSPPSSLDSRMVIYQVSEKIIKDNWLLGVGLGNFQEQYLNYQSFFSPFPQWAVPHAHNILTHLWTEIGIIGLAGFILILFYIVYQLINKQKTPFKIIIGVLITYFLVHGLVDMTIWKNDLSLFFWFLVFIL